MLSKHVDFELGIDFFGGRESLFYKYLFLFPNDDSITSIKEGYSSGDIEKIYKSAHHLKGLSGNIYIHTIYISSMELLVACKNKKNNLIFLLCKNLISQIETVSKLIIQFQNEQL